MGYQAHSLFVTPVASKGGSLTEGVVGIPRFINPVIAVSDVERDLSALIYAGLMKYDNGKLVGNLAESYEISEDGLTYTFTLKPDIKFHDKTPVTADDVEFTIQKIQDAAVKSPRRADWADITVNKIDATTIQFVLKQAYSPFIENTTLGIIPKHIWKNVGSEQFNFSQYNIEPIGAGPYAVDSIERDSGGLPLSYELESWNGYSDQAAYIDNLSIKFFPSSKALVEAYNEGVVESMYGVTAQDIGLIISDDDNEAQVIRSPLPILIGIFLNQNQAPVLAYKEVRQALDMAVPRERLVEEVLGGYGVIAQSPLPRTYYDRSTSTPSYDSQQSVNNALALLEKAGWTLGPEGILERKTKSGATEILSFSITTTASTPGLKQAAEIVAMAWKEIGVHADVRVFDGDLSQNVIRPRKYDALLFGEVIGSDIDLYPFWHSSQRTGFGLNISQYVNSKTDKLLEDARATSDTASRDEKYRAFEKIIQEDIPAIFLYSPEFTYIVPKAVQGIELKTMTTPADRWNDIEHWYVSTDKVWNIFVK
ncbi:MAG: ABC transporter substrate-binding protein [Patescibacteria group bacterium]